MEPPQATNLEEANRIIAAQFATIAELTQTTAKLQSQVAWLTRQLFGRKSERFDASQQPQLFADLPQSQPQPAAPEPSTQTIQYQRTKPGGKREPIPDDLPRQVVIHDLTEDQKVGMKKIGEEVSERLEIEPGRVYVRRDVQYKCARVEQVLDGTVPNVQIAEKPVEGLPRCLAGPSSPQRVAVATCWPTSRSASSAIIVCKEKL